MKKPDLSKYGLICDSVLQTNHQGGRTTYLASFRDEPSRKVIIKQFTFAKSSSEWSAYKSIEREINSLKNLDHPQIPKYIDSFEDENGLCVAIEYLEAENLDRAKHRITIELAYDITLQILDILVYLQSQKPVIIHQDIKPQNILIDPNNRVYLIDFGLAREDNIHSLSASSTIGGTIGFITPEQIYQRKINNTTDIYALAVTYFCLLLKISHEELVELVNMKTGQPPMADKLSNVTNPNIIDWLLKATNTSVERRFTSAKQARIELERISPALVDKAVKTIKLSKESDFNPKPINISSDSAAKYLGLAKVTGLLIVPLVIFVFATRSILPALMDLALQQPMPETQTHELVQIISKFVRVVSGILTISTVAMQCMDSVNGNFDNVGKNISLLAFGLMVIVTFDLLLKFLF